VPTLSTHVLDGNAGGGREAVPVEVCDANGIMLANGVTDASGRIADLGGQLPRGNVQIRWELGAPFLHAVTASITLDQERHYHVPLLWSGTSATVYLGA
jgi:5-hydroxyisourate hydrolase